MPSIEVEGLVKRYGPRTVLDDVSFVVEPGTVVGLLGPNGAGKTTTLSVLCGLLVPEGGHATVMGHDVTRHPGKARADLGIVFQETVLYELLTARENLHFHGRLHRMPRSRLRERTDEVLALVQLTERADTRVETFSGGMKRRLALAQALLHDPPVILLDEPTLGIDVQARNAIWDQVRRLRDDGRAVLLNTNYMDEAEALADRLVVLDRGRVVATATPDELRRSTGVTSMNDVFLALTGRELRD